MKYMGIDYGEKRIGTAVSDGAGKFAFSRETILNDTRAVATILEQAEAERVDAFVIGIPETGGEKNPVEHTIRAFAEELGEVSELPVYFQNEHFSSVEATRFSPDGQKSDAVSAAIILQRYLDANTQTK